MAVDVVAERSYDSRQHILPLDHLDSQDGETHAQLDANRPRARRKLLQQQQYLVAQLGQVGGLDLGGEVKCDLMGG